MAWFRRSDEPDNHYPDIDPDMDPNMVADPDLRARLRKRQAWKKSLIQQQRSGNRGRTVEEKLFRGEAEENARPRWVRHFWTIAAWIVGSILAVIWLLITCWAVSMRFDHTIRYFFW